MAPALKRVRARRNVGEARFRANYLSGNRATFSNGGESSHIVAYGSTH